MEKHLYFICPTDHLEMVIKEAYNSDHYFITSLGNSIALHVDKVDEINALIETKGIGQITLILSDDNRIVLDALGNQEFSDIQGLGNLYVETTKQKTLLKLLWQKSNPDISILSYHLNTKIKELRSKLNNRLVGQIKIDARIYLRQLNAFREIHPDLLHREYYSLN